ncbi:hypothetical protein P175DRAFT_0428556 [Aspergillus ochraceoroseus IBT 24754]|uniref:Polysaccharide biosynthesis domain-containing protein n=1 Tax=Aspergillus ochraceoroseus IBT 24754 TaxID=1392256 RepID=A0A2T5M6I3_9EURO|nr:uncharacterized protein P175DRAFT_0428556 [Aspergillus ochraceoroseus IBT 24754]PTU24116.1 hypothetical protein P175DRAFT_0428556 [Aspergillus ochraceoroseus IBT 24754]
MSKPFDPETAENLEDMERQFAVKAVEHLMTYWSILEKVRGSELRLTKMDDEIYEHFKKEFPEFDPAETIDEDNMKSKEGKEKWRNWVNQYEDKIHDFNFGTMLRASAKTEYDRDNTIFGECYLDRRYHLINEDRRTNEIIALRMQFYAIEIARQAYFFHEINRAGLNDWVYEQAQGKK